MNEQLKKQLEAFTKKAKKTSGKTKSTRGRSSLHQIIKTKEQADRFMKMMQTA